jgi:uncharacterized phage protein (TIGR02218 family)
MSAPAIYHYTSWDHFAASKVTKLLEVTSSQGGGIVGWAWQGGSVGSMIAGLRGVGQAIRAPSSFRLDFDGVKEDTIIVSFLFRQSSFASERDVVALYLGGTPQVYLRVNTSGLLKIVNIGTGGSTIGTSVGPALQVDTVYKIEFACWVNDTTGKTQVRVNGSNDAALLKTNVDTKGAGGTGTQVVSRVWLDNPVADYDDFVVLKGTGGFQDTDLITDTAGNPKIATLYPIADGDYLQFTRDTGSLDYYTYINETVMSSNNKDDSPGWLSAPGPGSAELQSWRGTQMPSDAVTVIDIGTITAIHGSPASAPDYEHYIRIGGTDYPSNHAAFQNASTTFEMIMRRWPVSPAGNITWTPALVNANEYVLENRASQSSTMYFTQAVTVALYNGTTPNADSGSGLSLLSHKTHHFANLFRVERADTTVLRYTDCNASIVFTPPGLRLAETYKPAGGMQSSAHRDESGLREPNVEVLGLLTDDQITADDLRAGRYRDAKVTRYVVDWRFPWAGPIRTWVYWIADVEFDGSYWKAQLSGIAHKLRHKVGRYFSRLCDYDLGDADCKVNLFGLTKFNVNVTQVTDRRQFQLDVLDIPGTLPNDWFNFGYLTFLTGDNHDLTFEIRDYVTVGGGSPYREVLLQLPTPFDVVIGDTLNIAPGCNKIRGSVAIAGNGDCLHKYNNRINYGGFPFIVTSDGLLDTP